MALQPIYRKGMQAPDTRQEGVGLVDFSRAVKAGVDIQMGIDAANQRRGESIVKTQVELAKLPDTLAALHAGRIEAETRADIALATQEDKIAISAENLKAIQFEINELNMANKTSKIVAAMERRKLETQNMKFASTYGGKVSAGMAMLASNPNKPVVLAQLKPLYEIASQNPTSPMAMKLIDLYNKTAVEVEQVTEQNFMKGLPAQMTPEGEPKKDDNGQPVPDTDFNAIIPHAESVIQDPESSFEDRTFASKQLNKAKKAKEKAVSYQTLKRRHERKMALVTQGVDEDVANAQIKSEENLAALGEGKNTVTANAISTTFVNKAKAFYINSGIFKQFKTTKSWEENIQKFGESLQSEIDTATKDMEPNEKEIFINQLKISFLNSHKADIEKEIKSSQILYQQEVNSAAGDRDVSDSQGFDSIDGMDATKYAETVGEHGWVKGVGEWAANIVGFTAGVKNSANIGKGWSPATNGLKSNTLPFRMVRSECNHAISMIDALMKDPRTLSRKQYNDLELAKRKYKALKKYTEPGFHTCDDDIQNDVIAMYDELEKLYEASTGMTNYGSTKAQFIKMSEMLANPIDSLGIDGLSYHSALYQKKGRRYKIKIMAGQQELAKTKANINVLQELVFGQQNQAVDTLGAGNPNYVPSDNSKKQMPPLQ